MSSLLDMPPEKLIACLDGLGRICVAAHAMAEAIEHTSDDVTPEMVAALEQYREAAAVMRAAEQDFLSDGGVTNGR